MSRHNVAQSDILRGDFVNLMHAYFRNLYVAVTQGCSRDPPVRDRDRDRDRDQDRDLCIQDRDIQISSRDETEAETSNIRDKTKTFKIYIAGWQGTLPSRCVDFSLLLCVIYMSFIRSDRVF